MDLVRDLLDEEVIDRNRREMGRVDSIVLAVEQGRAPRVVAIELGIPVVARRLSPALGRLAEKIARRFGADQPSQRIPIGDVIDIRDRVKVDRP